MDWLQGDGASFVGGLMRVRVEHRLRQLVCLFVMHRHEDLPALDGRGHNHREVSLAAAGRARWYPSAPRACLARLGIDRRMMCGRHLQPLH